MTSTYLAVRPPEYWPRLSYMALMQHADVFVLADTFQYSRQSFQNRTRLRTPQGWQWISIPLMGGQHGTPIHEVQIDNRTPWMRKHWRSLTFNYQSTPYFEFYEPLLAPLFAQTWHTLGSLTCATVTTLHQILGYTNPIAQASSYPTPPRGLSEVLHHYPDQQLMVPSSSAVHDADVTDSVTVFNPEIPPYRQNFAGFEPDMSVLDLLFNYGPASRMMLQQG